MLHQDIKEANIGGFRHALFFAGAVAPVVLSAVVVLLSQRAVLPSAAAGPLVEAPVVLLVGAAISTMLLVVLLAKAIGTLRTSIAEHRGTVALHEDRERVARASERQYRVLFEDAMQAAYSDLDRLNTDLREQKDYLQRKMEEQDRTAVELRESEERWRHLVERNPEGIIITRARRILYANDVAVSLVGNTLEDVAGRSVLDFLPPESWKLVERQIRDNDSNLDSEPIQLPICALDGTRRWIEVYSVGIKFRGRPAAQTVIRDVTERRIAEHELLKSTERIAALHDIAQSILSDDTPRVVAENALAHLRRLVPLTVAAVVEVDQVKGEARMLLFDSGSESVVADPVGAPIGEFGCEPPKADTPEYVYHSMMRTARTRMSRIESTMYLAGVRSYVEIPLVIKGEWVGVIYVGSDKPDGFTEGDCDVSVDIARMIAVTMHQQHIEAERLGYENELLAAKEHAEEMARLKTAFLANMSHEIRTPLTGIIGFAQVLSEEITDQISEEHGEFVHMIEQSGRRLLDTINSVLDLARLESNRMRMKLEPLRVCEEIAHTTRLLEPLAIKKDLYLRVEADTNVSCNLDSTILARVLNNLVGNAIKFTVTGGVTVRVRERDGLCVIQVIDTGVGISEEFVPQLFQEFRQESTGLDRSHEGSGMGLAITRKLVEIMAGTIGISTKKHEGTTVEVRFPIATPVTDTGDRGPVKLSAEAAVEAVAPRSVDA